MSKVIEKSILLGVDQTGAVDRLGKPRPLPASFIKSNEIHFDYLKSFTKASIYEALAPRPQQKIAVCVDCVLGLPQEINFSWRKALDLIKNNDGYGRNSAEKFFFELGCGKIAYRVVEIKSHSNSVFKVRPYQKNIQTGTYRIWKDISQCSDDFSVPFLQEPLAKAKIPIYEGYPSLSWKLLFGVKFRAPDILPKLVSLHFPELFISGASLKALKQDVNLADALVLALSLKKFRLKPTIQQICANEGWILGQK